MVESADMKPFPATPLGVPAKGDIIAGKYVVERLLGVGGMGAVVAARHQTLGQDVAIKVLLREAADLPGAAARFLREAQAVLGIRSEHVARVLDVGSLDDGGPYMVMELLAGEDLAVRLSARGTIPIAEAVEYVLQACEALAEAHSLGIVHRDLKPSNLFVAQRADGSPLVKVLDFGIAKAVARAPTEKALTATGSVMGSPQYMSPEQVRDSKNVDVRADIWALGVILHELMTGKPPFEGESAAAICAAIAADPAKCLRDVLPGAPAGLEDVLLGCLQKNVAQRVPDVAVLARALEPFAEPSARISVERIVRTVERRRDGTPSVSRPKLGASAFAETVASQPARPGGHPAGDASGAPAHSGREGVVSRVAWTASLPGKSGRARLAFVGAIVAVACVGVAAWALRSASPVDRATGSAGASPPPAVASASATPGPAPATETPSAPTQEAGPHVAPAAPVDDAPVTTVTASPIARRVAPAVKPHAAPVLSPTPSPAAPAPAPNERPKGGPTHDPLGDRK